MCIRDRLSIERARRLNPRLVVMARTELAGHGVDTAVQPEFEGGVEMVRQALLRYDYEEGEAARLAAEVRREFYFGVT